MSIGKIGINQDRDPISLWRIYMPSDIDRDKYIKKAYRSGRVTIANENGEVQHRVKIGKSEMQRIKFPADLNEYGSEVICLSTPYNGKLHIVGVFTSSTEISDQDENQYRWFKASLSKIIPGYAEIRVDGNGKILLKVNGTDDNSELVINVTSENKKGKLKLNVNGDILIQNEGDTTLTSSNNVNVKVTDGEIESSVDITKDEINLVSQTDTKVTVKKDEVRITTLDSGKIYLNESEEPILLGQKVVDFLSEILDQLGSESAGPYPLLGNSFYLSKKADLEALKSTLSFVK